MSKPILSSDATYLKLNEPGEFRRFYHGLIDLLKRKLQRMDFGGSGHYHYSCGEIHDRNNLNWDPFMHLWSYTDKKFLDFYAVKDLIEEHIGRKLECECEILRNEKAIRRSQLQQQFGVDFGEPGARGVDIV